MKHSKTLIFGLLIACLCVFFVKADIAHASTMIFSDDFNSYTPASGCPTNWDGGGSGSCSNASIVAGSDCLEGNCLYLNGGGMVRRSGTATSDGEISFYFKVSLYPSARKGFFAMGTSGSAGYFPFYIQPNGDIEDLFGSVIHAGTPLDTWTKVDVFWTDSGGSPSFTDFSIEFNNDFTLHNTNYSDYIGDISSIGFSSNNDGNVYFDYMGQGSYMPLPYASISSPASGTTITANTTTLNGTYGSLDAGSLGYGYLHIGFKNPNNGLYSQVFTFPATSSAGSFSTPLSIFNITENGTWDIQIKQELDANTFQDLTPTYNLIFAVSGNTEPYSFSDWSTWYSTNGWCLSGPCTPTDFANSIVGFIQPIFTNVYEFANNTLTFFNADTAHDKGYQIGQIFPTAQAYLDNINQFFGGFPLVPFFEFTIVIMLGIFIVRTIFKFIPFFG